MCKATEQKRTELNLNACIHVVFQFSSLDFCRYEHTLTVIQKLKIPCLTPTITNERHLWSTSNTTETSSCNATTQTGHCAKNSGLPIQNHSRLQLRSHSDDGKELFSVGQWMLTAGNLTAVAAAATSDDHVITKCTQTSTIHIAIERKSNYYAAS